MSTAALLAHVAACVVVHVADGDTLSVRCGDASGNRHVVVRLAEVDAPEDGQAFGAVSRRSLAARCLRQPATLVVRNNDAFGRTVAKVSCNGADAGAAQVADGLAWVSVRYARDRELYRLQEVARNDRRGLWADPLPIAPWEWRRSRAVRGEPRRLEGD